MRFLSYFNCLLVCLSAVVSSVAIAAELPAEFVLNGESQSRFVAGKPLQFEMFVMNPKKEGEVLADFQPMHMKIMHMVMIKKDLSHFSHVHPYYDMGSGIFNMTLNLASVHPDNFMSSAAMPTPGEYVAFTEAKSEDHGMKMWRFELTGADDEGQLPKSWRRELSLDPVNKAGEIVKYLSASGEMSSEGDSYKVMFSTSQVPGCGGTLINMEMNLYEYVEGKYQKSEKMEPWLMMGGHAILARDTGELQKNDFYHLHALVPENTTLYYFNVFNRGNLVEDNYRIWIQVKNAGRVLTIPFTFHFRPEAPRVCD